MNELYEVDRKTLNILNDTLRSKGKISFTSPLLSNVSLSRRLSQATLDCCYLGLIRQLTGVTEGRQTLPRSFLRDENRVELSLGFTLKKILKFQLWWTAIFGITFFRILLANGKDRKLAVIPESFKLFDEDELRKKLQKVTSETNYAIIAKKDFEQKTQDVIKCKFPLLSFFFKNKISRKKIVSFLWLHLTVLYDFYRLIFKCRFISLLFKDFAALSNFVLSENLTLFIVDNSQYNHQQIWFEHNLKRKYQLVTFWYSMNTQPFYTKSLSKLVGTEESFEIPLYYFYTSDLNFVWNVRHANWLQKFPYSGRCIEVGPIVFKGAPLKNDTLNLDSKSITVFDITPLSEQGHKKYYGSCYTYTNTRNLEKFITDLVTLSSRFGYRIYLKCKREYNSDHDSNYIKLITELEKEHKIQIIDYSTNLHDLIKASHLVVCIPFTSPYFIAEEHNIKRIYYDPTSEIEPAHKQHSGLNLIQGYEQLETYLMQRNDKKVDLSTPL